MISFVAAGQSVFVAGSRRRLVTLDGSQLENPSEIVGGFLPQRSVALSTIGLVAQMS